jgi:hypothetical protein
MALPMPQTAHALAFRPASSEAAAMMASIRHRWPRLAHADVEDLKTLESLTAAITSTYRFGANRAAAQVQEWAAGQVLLRADIERENAAPTPIAASTTPAAASSWSRDEFGLWH